MTLRWMPLTRASAESNEAPPWPTGLTGRLIPEALHRRPQDSNCDPASRFGGRMGSKPSLAEAPLTCARLTAT
jgi:hypothetical protein